VASAGSAAVAVATVTEVTEVTVRAATEDATLARARRVVPLATSLLSCKHSLPDIHLAPKKFPYVGHANSGIAVAALVVAVGELRRLNRRAGGRQNEALSLLGLAHCMIVRQHVYSKSRVEGRLATHLLA
jgi:hypothetical protein